MKRTKHTLFLFSPYQYKAVEEYLNRQAAQGWELVRAGVFAKFRATTRTDLNYCTDLLVCRRRNRDRERQREYLDLCRDAGWEPVARVSWMSMFASQPGKAPVPIQTDPAEERKAYRRSYLLGMALAILPFLCYAVMLAAIFSIADLDTAVFLSMLCQWPHSWAMAGVCLCGLLWAGPALWKMVDFIRAQWSVHRTGRIEAAPPWVMWANAAANLLQCLAALTLIAGELIETIQAGDRYSFCVILGVLGAVQLVWAQNQGEEVFPREIRNSFVAGAVLVALAAALAAAVYLSPGAREVYFLGNGSYEEYCEAAAGLSLLRDDELDAGRSEDYYVVERGFGPAGRYAMVMNDLNFELRAYSCTRYDCYTAGLAAWTADTLAAWAEQPEPAGPAMLWYYGGADMEPVELAWADEAWYGQWSSEDGERMVSVLVLRQGRLTACVSAPVPLWEGERLSAIQEWLEKGDEPG